jgi:hypothetical protein
MRFAKRAILVVAVLAVGLAVQFALRWHAEAAGALPRIPLAKRLEQLPTELGDWKGVDQEIKEQFQFGDEHLQRTYYHTKRRQYLTVWIVYSGTGADRGHHPEVCMMVAGKPEDRQARRTCELDSAGVPAQQYRFGTPGSFETVYYWYYTLVPPQSPEVDAFQRLYQRLSFRPASVTIEIFAPELDTEDARYASEFAKLLDRHFQQHLGPTAVRGNQRSPVVVVRGTET